MPREKDIRSQRRWARVAGLLYWVVLIVDITGLQMHAPVGRALSLAGAIFTIPLALGLYYAVRPEQFVLAACALGCRLLEAALGAISVIAGFPAIHAQLSSTHFGNVLLTIAEWDDSTNFAAFAFTLGSTIFFYLFVTSGYIPRILAWWGLFSSVLALCACAVHLARPGFPAMTMYAWLPMLLAETSTGLWLLVRSVHLGTPASRQVSVSVSPG